MDISMETRDENDSEQLNPADFDSPVPRYVHVTEDIVYVLTVKLGKGGYGSVYRAYRSDKMDDPNYPELVAIKFERKRKESVVTSKEWVIYDHLTDTQGLPKVYHRTMIGDYFVMVMDLLGENLYDVWRNKVNTVENTDEEKIKWLRKYAVQALEILERVHEKGIIHGDVKPHNFVFGRHDSKFEEDLYLIDFGLSEGFVDNEGIHVEYDQRVGTFKGTQTYASVNVLLGRTASRRDDLESLAYSLIHMLKGPLPWQGVKGKLCISKAKVEATPDALCGEEPCPLKDLLQYSLKLNFDEEPDYHKLKFAFKFATRNKKRKQREVAEEEASEDGGCRKKAKPGEPILKWVIVLTEGAEDERQRFSVNVSLAEIGEIIGKNLEERFLISHVVCSNNAWTLIYNLATQPNMSQLSYMTDNMDGLLQYIHENWNQGYIVTSLVCDELGRFLIVMTKGLEYNQQTYKVSAKFPFEWVQENWNMGNFVTAMAVVPDSDKWLIFATGNTEFTEQVVELGLLYPDDSIQNRSEQGYYITCCAANKKQCAFIFSKGFSEEPPNQETLLSHNFPGEEVQEDFWPNSYYISGVCIGRIAP